MPGGGLGQDGLRNSVSRVLLFSSTDSVTTKPSNILLISRVTSTFRCLGGAGAGDSPQLEAVRPGHDVAGELGNRRRSRAKERVQHTARLHKPGEMASQRLAGGTVQQIEQVPAQDAVDGAVRVRESFLEERLDLAHRRRRGRKIRGDVFDEDLAAQPLSEERDVLSDDRTEVQKDRRINRRERRQEPRQDFGAALRGRTGFGRTPPVAVVVPPSRCRLFARPS